MKILLTAINSKYIHSNPAVYSLRAYADEYAKHVLINEYTINHRMDYILREIFKSRPDVIAFSCYIWNLEYIIELAVELAKILPDVPIWLGGPEVSYDAAAFLGSNGVIKGIMVGEGEEIFKQLVRHYVSWDMPLEDIQGVVYRSRSGEIVENPRRAILNMNDTPFIYKDLSEFENRILYYETSRGCPFSCSYCLSSMDKSAKSVRFRSFSQVKGELQFFLDHNVKQVKFVDRTFNCNHKHAMEIWSYIEEHDNGITNFHFEISADLLNEEEIRLLSTFRPGLAQLEIGVQSTNGYTIEEIDRTMNFDKLCKNVRRIREGKNIHQHLDLIAGLPFEDIESFKHSFNQVYALRPDQLQLGFLKILKGTKMYHMVSEYGVKYRDKPPYEVLCTNWISYEEMLRLKAVCEMTEVYFNSGQFNTTIEHLVTVFETPFACFDALAFFYEEHGLNEKSHSRISRYEILLAFIRTQKEEHVSLYEDLLLYDLYLRENIKSRPYWAKDLQKYKNRIRDFYIKEEQSREFLKDYHSFNYKQLSKMTHIEPFAHDVMGDGKKGQFFILFEYRNRDELSYEASSYLVHV